MMDQYTQPITKLIEELAKLPGIGRKSAQRLAFHILDMRDADVMELAKAIVNGKKTQSTAKYAETWLKATCAAFAAA